ncbi:MAG: hypothetical protein CL915_04695 [Deltaproteobacteria bacterium]|nr:hypothetical protein [Deltaproteobacteria bacterium]
MILKTDPTILPVFFRGQNIRLFQIASHLNYHLKLSPNFLRNAKNDWAGNSCFNRSASAESFVSFWTRREPNY